MKLEKPMRVSLDVAKQRALAYLLEHRFTASRANCVALAIWPNHQMRSQGAGAAASRILKRLESDGLVKWTSNSREWGWMITAQGVKAANSGGPKP